ncbi:hypothetical protein [Rhodococcus ruber]|uniref:hypothetical protein n=1 Tax=Rhodococcus ruber TaxID=1830 RepID=UPI003D81BDC8
MSNEPTLAGLIADRKGTRSYDRLSDDCGGTPSSGRLHQMATKPLKNFPDPESIRGMAQGLGVTVTDIVMASARSLELPVYTGNDPSALSIGGAGDLDDSSKEALATVAREFIRLTSQRDEGAEDGSGTEEVPQSRPQAGGPEHRGSAGGDRGRPGAPIATRSTRTKAQIKKLKPRGLAHADQASQLDQVPLASELIPVHVYSDEELAARTGETQELRRRRTEGEPWDHPDPDGPEDGA